MDIDQMANINKVLVAMHIKNELKLKTNSSNFRT